MDEKKTEERRNKEGDVSDKQTERERWRQQPDWRVLVGKVFSLFYGGFGHGGREEC